MNGTITSIFENDDGTYRIYANINGVPMTFRVHMKPDLQIEGDTIQLSATVEKADEVKRVL